MKTIFHSSAVLFLVKVAELSNAELAECSPSKKMWKDNLSSIVWFIEAVNRIYLDMEVWRCSAQRRFGYELKRVFGSCVSVNYDAFLFNKVHTNFYMCRIKTWTTSYYLANKRSVPIFFVFRNPSEWKGKYAYRSSTHLAIQENIGNGSYFNNETIFIVH